MNNAITKLIKESKKYEELLARLVELKEQEKPLPLLVDGISEGALFALCASLVEDSRKKYKESTLIMVSEERLANKLNDFLKKIGLSSEFYQARDLSFYDVVASHEVECERLKILAGILNKSCDVVITTPDASIQLTVPPERLRSKLVQIKSDTSLEISQLVAQLHNLGYTSCEQVESPGQYSVRGYIVDLFPTSCEYKIDGKIYTEPAPVRIELFGDEIDRMAIFDTKTQRVSSFITEFSISPSREIIATDEQILTIKGELETLLRGTKKESTVAELKRELASLSTGDSSYPFFDKLISLVYPEEKCLLDYFSRDTIAIVCDSSQISRRAKDAEMVENELAKDLIDNELIPSKYAKFSAPVSKIDRLFKSCYTINVDPFIMSRLDSVGGIFNFNTKGTHATSHSISSVLDDLSYFAKSKYKTLLVCQTEAEAKNAVSVLCDEGYSAYSLARDLKEGAIAVTCDTFPEGFEIPSSRLALVVLSSRNRLDKSKIKRKANKNKSAGEKILSCQDLMVGDYVVHEKYGIGKYLGIQNLFTMGAHRDYIAIQYSGSDKLYLPVDQLDMVSKYIGASSSTGEVKLSKMGGTEWKRAKSKAKSSAKDMAKELIDLYARRTRMSGFAFMPDDIMEIDFESSFEYDETDSQLLAISEIKSDMEKPYPMDRVLCGDVGYGKTEVALRAAMKAVSNNKQVAILVPTTILAMQHYQTALSRFAGTGVNIDMISRFRTQKEQSAILSKLKKGSLDIIIGTHKLLGSSVTFKDLGLLIIDEEQRFGVAQKEKIKKAYPYVDVLSLSATPIPRTLSMAMGGIRDLSILDESPEGRVGTQSYVMEYNEPFLNDAIKRELHRGGQVFYLVNNIDRVYSIADRLQKTFPNNSVSVAHGQMDRDSLERIWHNLVVGEIDILVCTTIIETGIDIPNANTLIIENADKMGLAQLHQIRGRVGRSHRRAYAFFTYPPYSALTGNSRERLSAIRDFAEFGAGFKIAMRDLEIRGAGDLLGSSQHGHLDAVGYDLYIRLLNEAVLEEKGELIPQRQETTMVISSDAFLPPSYVSSSSQRMELYKRIAHIESEEEKLELESEITDRFGKMPAEAKMLTSVAIVKHFASIAQIRKVEQLSGEIRLYPTTTNLMALGIVSQFDKENVRIVGIKEIPYISIRYKPSESFAEKSIAVLKLYAKALSESSV
ncbi:MAG: transcription-repair coupling factor [Clostridia bacterium]|nr:transcription-repair coupling factor [Clostridia bacterium]